MLPSIEVHFIGRPEQRYDTWGDWQERKGVLHISISRSENDAADLAVAIHEVVEWYLCRQSGITEAQVDDWDFAHPGDEAGDNPQAPYHRAHVLAIHVEKTVLGVIARNAHERMQD